MRSVRFALAKWAIFSANNLVTLKRVELKTNLGVG
jgi:hypothetical protein